jgi:hypothetical protein
VTDDLPFPIFDEPAQGASSRQSDELPSEEWDRMVALANHLAERDAISPLKRRLRMFLSELAYAEKSASSSEIGGETA